MKKIFAASLIVFSQLPGSAVAEEENGTSLMEEGAKLFLKGIMNEMGPAMEGLRDLADDMEPAMRQFVQEMGPAIKDLMGKIDDLSAYHPPVMLPNGDIILRKKTPEEMGRPQGEIEL